MLYYSKNNKLLGGNIKWYRHKHHSTQFSNTLFLHNYTSNLPVLVISYFTWSILLSYVLLLITERFKLDSRYDMMDIQHASNINCVVGSLRVQDNADCLMCMVQLVRGDTGMIQV